MLADELTTSSASTRTWTSTSWRSAATAFLDRRGRDPTLGEPVEQARSDEVAPVVGAQHCGLPCCSNNRSSSMRTSLAPIERAGATCSA